MNKIKRIKILMTAVMLLIGGICIITGTVETSHAAGRTVSGSAGSGAKILIRAENDSSEDEVPVIEEPMKKGESLLTTVIKFIGFMVGLVSLLFLLISFPTHQSEIRNMSLVGFIVALGIYFSPELVNWLLGRK